MTLLTIVVAAYGVAGILFAALLRSLWAVEESDPKAKRLVFRTLSQQIILFVSLVLCWPLPCLVLVLSDK